jgi:hypothetical protein
MAQADELKRFQAKWVPVGRPEARKNKNLKRHVDFIWERAASGQIPPQHGRTGSPSPAVTHLRRSVH